MAKTRDYSYKDVDMLMASKTVAESFGANLSELSTVHSNWTKTYADNLNIRIDAAIESYLGIDPKKELREATSHITAIHYPAIRDLSFFKAQIDDDFEKHPTMRSEILKSLGFSKYLHSVQKGNIESLAQLLNIFKHNMDEELHLVVTAKGLNPALIDAIMGYANIFEKTNVSQESLSDTDHEITPEAVDIFNFIYIEIMDICRIASEYYQYEPQKKEMFTFSKVVASIDDAKRVWGYDPQPTIEWYWTKMPTIVGV